MFLIGARYWTALLKKVEQINSFTFKRSCLNSGAMTLAVANLGHTIHAPFALRTASAHAPHMQPDNLSTTISDADRQLIAAAYNAFNARQLDEALATMHPAVAWPRAWEGDHVQGAAQVRTYWTQQWQEISPVVEPMELSRLPDGRTAVLVQQTVHDLSGKLLHEGQTIHVYTIREGLIQRMDIQPVPQ